MNKDGVGQQTMDNLDRKIPLARPNALFFQYAIPKSTLFWTAMGSIPIL
jgi:hypothetical protein